MKSYTLEKAGSSDSLLTTEAPRPTPRAGEVLIRVKAIAINPVDVKARASDGVLSWLFGDERPVVLGWDVAGEVIEVGPNTSQFSVGDRVFGMLNFPEAGRAYAEFALAKTDHIALIPEDTDFKSAAAATLACLTAYQCLRGNVNPGDRLLIHAAAGGVGHYAVQLAKLFGAHVIGTSSSKNRPFLERLGVDRHIDYRTQDVVEELDEVDFVLDGLGGEVMRQSVQVTKRGGKVVTLPVSDLSPAEELARERGVDLSFHLVEASGTDMKQIAEWLAAGSLKSEVEQVYPFDRLGDAHRHLETGRTVGKVVVELE
ncbi:MAG: NADP-dependent oxidoreductase [Myxococcota bacterium]